MYLHIRIKQRILHCVLLGALALGLPGCIDDPVNCRQGEALVRIQAGLVIPGSGLRGEPVVVGGDPTDDQHVGTVEERYVGSIRVMAFRGDLQIRNQVYRVPAAALAPGEKHFTYNGSDPSVMQMDLELPAGDYEFILVANEDPDLPTALNLQNVTSKADLINGNAGKGINTTDIINPIATPLALRLQTEEKKIGLMMIGRQSYRVAPEGTAGSPVVLNPVILMKRVLSKVELSLQNTQADGTVYPNARYTTLKRVELIRANKTYHLFEENSTPVSAEQYLVDGGAYPTSYHVDITHTQGEAYPQWRVLMCYMAERKNVVESAATTLKIVVENDGVLREYTVPLYSMKGGVKDYNIYRNTIYRLNAVFSGPDIVFESGLSVSPWGVVNTGSTIGEGDLI